MAETEENFWDEWAEPLIFGALAIACLAIFAQTTGFDFINLDDHAYVYLNDVVLSGLNTESIKWSFAVFHSSNWHPLTWMSHATDVSLFGLNAGAHHAVNVIIHIANSCLAFVVFKTYTGSIWKSAMVAMLFAVHPAHVESVAWISERKDVLSTLFWLLTMLAYARYAKGDTAGQPLVKRFTSPYLIAAFLLLAVGLLAKPMLVTLPFVLLLLDLWPLKRITTAKSVVPLLIEKIPMFLLAVGSSIMTYSAQKASGAVLGLERFPIDGRVMNSAVAYVKYIFMLFYPADLAVWYPFEPVSTATFIAALFMLIAITALAIWQLRQRPYIAVGWFWFVGTLVPVIGLVQVGAQSMADRYTYVPYFGLFIIIVWGAAEFIGRFQIDHRVVAVLSTVVVLAFGLVSFVQASYWKNSETLYTRTIAITKDNYFLKNLLCRHYIDKTPTANAERRCSELLGNSTNYLDAHNTIGLLRVELGRYDDALASYSKALQIKPNTALIYSNMSVAYSKKGDTEQADKHLTRAIELNDKTLSRQALAYAFNALGEAYAAKNEPLKARASFESAIKFDPELGAAKENVLKIQGATK